MNLSRFSGLGGPLALAGLSLLVLAVPPGCGSGKTPYRPTGSGGPFAPDAAAPPETPPPPGPCTPARASEDLRPRADLTAMIMGTPMMNTTRLVPTADLYARMYPICGGCHADAASGGKQFTRKTFATAVDETWLAAIKQEDPTRFMPPPPLGKPFSMRSGNDSVLGLVKYLEAWIAAGRPADVFPVEGEDSGSSSGYAFTPDVAEAMTNLGNCVPDKYGFATSASGVMESLDEMFATATELPPNLSQTDLTTFDGEQLAATGVIAYVPTYPLWSAGSGKLRHIRVPHGMSVRFDKEKQTFEIPPNTRFYKTFFRKVIDRTGHETNRKMETRVIVARPDRTLPDGTVQQMALFGTYVWSEDEMTATLGNLPYRDGTMFADQVRTYITDELAYQDLVDSVGPGANYENKLAKAIAGRPDLQHHYAIPGRIRCVQCHMGSPTNDFVLGFFPLQVARRDDGTGGTYEPTGDDELNQLQRLIDYGVISGMDSPADVLPLEKSQGKRKPRTEEELKAQAYMVGNCAHCHNPRGLPSISKPELANVLDFMPSADGGVFEFPLERMSPVRARGADGQVPIPYITPSLRDYPAASYPDLIRRDNGKHLGSDDGEERTWTPKYNVAGTNADSDNTCAANTQLSRAYCGKRKTGMSFVPAPWRSLIYRNVDTPYPYFDDYVPFPHMPMNTPGFDCRAPRIMGDWMVGLPAVKKDPAVSDDTLPFAGQKTGFDGLAQPYAEVVPGDPGFPGALERAKARLAEYREGVRYQYCEDDLSPDIYDTISPETSLQYRPDPGYFVFPATDMPVNKRTGEYFQPPIGVPYHSHFFSYDPTDSPPPWSPRRPNWQKVLVDREADEDLPASISALTDDMIKDRRLLVAALNEATYSDELRTFANAEAPFGLWMQKPECSQKLASAPKAADIQQRPTWMKAHPPSPDARVYMSSPGTTLYRHVCFNCHGPRADGKGLQADALAASSEGEARPANFHEGLFGPSASPGANLAATFSVGATPDPAAALNWGSRYMAWMALGGTLKKIPWDVIRMVEATTVLGERRHNLQFLPSVKTASANMLNLAKGLCSVVLPDMRPGTHFSLDEFRVFALGNEPEAYPPFNHEDAPFIAANGDKELWLDLCSRFSPPVVRVYSVIEKPQENKPSLYDVQLSAFYYASYPGAASYPADAEVLDQDRVVRMGVSVVPKNGAPPNYYPACLERPSAAGVAWLADKPVITKTHLPYCPPEFLAKGKLMWGGNAIVDEYNDNMTRWELRGAIAAGMTVFTYLHDGGAQTTISPAYDQCQLLK